MLGWSHNTRSDEQESKLDILRSFQSQLKNFQENMSSYIMYAANEGERPRIIPYQIWPTPGTLPTTNEA